MDARCICPSSFAVVTGSFALATEDRFTRFKLLLFRACPHCTRLSFVCQALFCGFKRYTVGSSKACCRVSRLTCLDCTTLVRDCQALFSVAAGGGAALSLTGKAILPQPTATCQHFFKKNSGALVYIIIRNSQFVSMH